MTAITPDCWNAAGLQNVQLENYGYRTYAYHNKGAEAVPDGTYIVLNNVRVFKREYTCIYANIISRMFVSELSMYTYTHNNNIIMNSNKSKIRI